MAENRFQDIVDFSTEKAVGTIIAYADSKKNSVWEFYFKFTLKRLRPRSNDRVGFTHTLNSS